MLYPGEMILHEGSIAHRPELCTTARPIVENG